MKELLSLQKILACREEKVVSTCSHILSNYFAVCWNYAFLSSKANLNDSCLPLLLHISSFSLPTISLPSLKGWHIHC